MPTLTLMPDLTAVNAATAETDDGLILGIDLGGTKTAAILVDATDHVLARAVGVTDRRSPVAGIISVVRTAMSQLDGAADRLRAVGVGVPGDVDSGTGTVRMAVNLEARDLPLGKLLGEALGVPCFVEHDARAAAAWLADRDGDGMDLAYLAVGTGISAGIVLGGRLLSGDNGLAGEVGHCIADPNGPQCPCGMRGCLEAVAAGPAVALAARLELERGVASELSVTHLTAEAVYAAAGRGDALAVRITTAAGASIARAVRGLALTYGVRRVIIGGGPTRAGAAFSDPLMGHLDQERAASPLVRRAVPEMVELLPANADATAWGAVTVARIGLEQGTVATPGRRVGPLT